MSILHLTASHVYAADELPLLHKDPFDRMIVSQARVENLHLVSHDETVGKYSVTLEW